MKVVALYRYLVKAMAAEALETAQLGWAGFEGDRRHAFVQSENRSDFPWLTIREVPALTTYVPFARDGSVSVRTPTGRELPVESPELADELAAAGRRPVHLLHSGRGLFDAVPRLGREPPDGRRRRRAGRAGARSAALPAQRGDRRAGLEFPEEALIGRELRIGAARIRLDVRDSRCSVINFDPHTAERDPAVLRAVARHREKCAAVYGSCVEPGEVRVGDAVVVGQPRGA